LQFYSVASSLLAINVAPKATKLCAICHVLTLPQET
jgi:hypothetical protein